MLNKWEYVNKPVGMPVKILMSGPIRPSEEAVLEVIQSLRRQFPDCVIFLSTWESQNASHVKGAVDYYVELPEPKNEDIANVVTQRTRQQRELGLSDETPGCKYALYKMLYGVETVCKFATPFIQNSDIVMRIRTDSMFLFSPGYVETLLSHANDSYIARKGDGFDWFCITTFAHLKRIWCFSSLNEYNNSVYNAWNPEDVIRRRVHIPIVYLDPSMSEYYIIRENGRKHYYT